MYLRIIICRSKSFVIFKYMIFYKIIIIINKFEANYLIVRNVNNILAYFQIIIWKKTSICISIRLLKALQLTRIIIMTSQILIFVFGVLTTSHLSIAIQKYHKHTILSFGLFQMTFLSLLKMISSKYSISKKVELQKKFKKKISLKIQRHNRLKESLLQLWLDRMKKQKQ